MEVRKSKLEDIPHLMEIYREAREIQLESGNLHQWAEGYPPEDVIRKDIALGQSYVVADSGAIVGVFALIFGKDPTYSHIEGGSWIDDIRPYATIHRLGSLKSSHGVAQTCFDWSWAQIPNLRIDTHKDNGIMRHCLEKAGFRYCGIIYLISGATRLAFQKI